MKIFSWTQNKRNAKGSGRQTSVAVHQRFVQESSRQEFSDWPNGLLTIGTFGYSNVTKELDRSNPNQSKVTCQEHVRDITPEEVEELQKGLNLLTCNEEVEGYSLVELDINLESYKTSGGKESQLDSVGNAIGNKSMSFLFKRKFLSSSDLFPTRSLRDPFPQSKHEKSRLRKILRSILSKKINPQSSSPKATTAKRYLENKKNSMADSKDEMSDDVNDGSKWIKTDAEFIVLEI